MSARETVLLGAFGNSCVGSLSALTGTRIDILDPKTGRHILAIVQSAEFCPSEPSGYREAVSCNEGPDFLRLTIPVAAVTEGSPVIELRVAESGRPLWAVKFNGFQGKNLTVTFPDLAPSYWPDDSLGD